MVLSMTGFGKATVEVPGKKITVEVKSLNSKQLDVSMRVPALFHGIELELRSRLAAKLERGKVDLNVYVESQGDTQAATINLDLVASYKRQIEQMAATLGIPEPADWYETLLRMPDIYRNETSADATEEETAALLRCADEAIAQLMEFRAQEGRKLGAFFTLRVDRIADLLAEVPQYETERVAKIRARITDNLEQLPKAEYDRNRLEQEMIFYIEKLDINEEKQRLANHLSYFKETLDGPHGQGKKLGFISQEMGREINTLGSKSNHAEMQRIVVKMKDELEQIKEQVLNAM